MAVRGLLAFFVDTRRCRVIEQFQGTVRIFADIHLDHLFIHSPEDRIHFTVGVTDVFIPCPVRHAGHTVVKVYGADTVALWLYRLDFTDTQCAVTKILVRLPGVFSFVRLSVS